MTTFLLRTEREGHTQCFLWPLSRSLKYKKRLGYTEHLQTIKYFKNRTIRGGMYMCVNENALFLVSKGVK